MIPTHQWTETTHIKMGRKGKVTFLINPTPRTPIWSGGNAQLPISPWGTKDLDHKTGSPIFKAPNQAMGPSNHLALKAQRACFHEPHRTTANKEAGLNRGTSPHLAYHLRSQKEKAGQKKPISQSFPRRSLTACFTSYYIRFKLMSEGPASN